MSRFDKTYFDHSPFDKGVWSKIAATVIGNKVAAIGRRLALIRQSSVIVGALVTATRGIATLVESSFVIVGVVASATRNITVTRQAVTKIGVLVSAIYALIGKVFRMLIYSRPCRDMTIYARPYYEMEVHN